MTHFLRFLFSAMFLLFLATLPMWTYTILTDSDQADREIAFWMLVLTCVMAALSVTGFLGVQDRAYEDKDDA